MPDNNFQSRGISTTMKNRYATFLGIALLVVFAMCATATNVRAQTLQLTLDQALEIADEKNRDIQKARDYIVWAKGKYVEERAAALPQLTATASALRDRDGSQKIYGAGMEDPANRQSAQ